MVLTVFMCGASMAATTCLHNRTKIYTLKKSVDGTSSSYDATDLTWSVTFSYDLVPNNSSARTLYGTATCNEINTNSDGNTASSGSANVYLRASTGEVGTQCWCAMSHPVSSWWVFLKEYSDEASCASGCARDCASAVKSNTGNFRTNGVYLAIW